MEILEIIKHVSDILKVSENDAFNVISNSMTSQDPFSSLSDLLGLSNIDLIFEISKNKEYFEAKDQVNTEAMFIEHVIPEVANSRPTEKLVPVSELKKYGRYFSYTHFNPVQSAVFKNVFKTDSNVLISAPTGAGKTDIALLAILRALRHMNSQIIYIVPMKALATEIYHKYKKLFEKEFSVIEYTGDTDIDYKVARNAKIIICTPEKFDSASRKHHCVFENIKLVIIDEIHLLEDDRGPVLEAIVARMYRMAEIRQSQIRIVGLSATLPNYYDVGKFIKAENIHFFDSRYRPVPLKMTVTGFTKSSTFRDENDYLIEKITNFINMDKQVLVFVHSRAKTFKVAKLIAQNIALENICPVKSSVSGDLLYLVSSGVGVHNAGLSRKDRLEMERLFRDGKIKILVTTSTLAWGVNLPAYGVIINGSTFYNPTRGNLDDVSVLDILQIFGRAGRPQYDTKGEAILMTTANKIDKYVKLLKRSSDIESKMLFHVPECINAEIYLKSIDSIASALSWIRNTFLFVRMAQNPAFYGLREEDLGLEEQALSEYVYLTVKRLEDARLIDVKKKDNNYNTWTYESTFYGQVTSLYYLHHMTMYNWLKDLDTVTDEFSLISLLLRSEEFKNIQLRKDEIGYLNDIHQNLLLERAIDFEFRETLEDKLMILLISFLRFSKIVVYSLACDQDFLVDNLKRLISGFKHVLDYHSKYDLYLIVFLLEKKLYRYKKQKLVNSDVAVKRINSEYIEISVKSEIYDYTCFLFDDNKLIDIIKSNGTQSHILKYPQSSLTIKLHSDYEWCILEKDLEITSDYSPYNLFKYATHFCDRRFDICGRKSECIHFQELAIAKAFAHSLSLDLSQSVSFNTNNLDKMKEIREEKFNLIVDFNFMLKINFLKLATVFSKERLKIATNMISKMDIKDCLIVCSNAQDAKDTVMQLNTLSALSHDTSKMNFHLYGDAEHVPDSNCVCSFSDALNVKDYRNVIFKSVTGSKGIFPLSQVFMVCHRRNATVIETPELVIFLESIINKTF